MDPVVGSIGEEVGFVMDDAMFEELLGTQTFTSDDPQLSHNDLPSPSAILTPLPHYSAADSVPDGKQYLAAQPGCFEVPLEEPPAVALSPDSFPLSPLMFSGKPGLMQPVADGATKWLPNEIIEQVLRHSQAPEVRISTVPAQNPSSGQLFLYNKAVTKKWRSDGGNWQRSEGGRIREHHENLKVDSVPTLNACYLRENYEGEDATTKALTRRAYWLLHPGDPAVDGIVLVHYLIHDSQKPAKNSSSKNDGKKRQRAITPHRLEPAEDEAAAVALQKVYRGSAVRQKLHRAEDGATMIQRNVRDFLARKQVKTDGAARVLQHAWKRKHRPMVPNRTAMHLPSIIPPDNQQPPGFCMADFEVKQELSEWGPQIQTVTGSLAEFEITDPQNSPSESAAELENKVLRQELGMLRTQIQLRDAKIVEYESELRLSRAMVAELMEERSNPTPSLPISNPTNDSNS